MNKMYLPTVGPQDWQKLLADPEKQWRTGYSARTIAYAWEAAKGHFPPEVERIFPEAGDERAGNLEILLEFPEWKVYLPPAGHCAGYLEHLFTKSESHDSTIALISQLAVMKRRTGQEPLEQASQCSMNIHTPLSSTKLRRNICSSSVEENRAGNANPSSY
jgi:hypothetical protein